jgi:hypothetical protein
MKDLICDPFYTYKSESVESDDTTFRDFEGAIPTIPVDQGGVDVQVPISVGSAAETSVSLDFVAGTLQHYYSGYFNPPQVEGAGWDEAKFENDYNGTEFEDVNFNYDGGVPDAQKVNKQKHFKYLWADLLSAQLEAQGGPGGEGWNQWYDELDELRRSPVLNAAGAFVAYTPPAIGGDLYINGDTIEGGANGVVVTAVNQYSQFNVDMTDAGGPAPHLAGSITQWIGEFITEVQDRWRPGVRVDRGLESQVTLSPYVLEFGTVAQHEPVKNEVRQARMVDLRFKENLLLPLGMSHYAPEKIYTPVDAYPPLIQDFDVRITSSQAVRYRDFSPDLSGCTLELQPQTDYTLSTYTTNTFKQEEKPIQKIEVLVPKIDVLQKTFEYSATGKYEIKFETEPDRPDKVFIYIERVSGSADVFDERNPCVKGVDVKVMGQSVQSVADLDEFETYNATRRNAALRCDLLALRKRTGGVLLSLPDLCEWVDFDFLQRGKDTFKGSFVVEESQIRQLDTTIVDPVTAAERALLDTQQRKINVLFIYENWCVKGEASTMRYYQKSKSELEEKITPKAGGYR